MTFNVETRKAASLKWCPSSHARANIEECYDAIEEDGASSNTPYNVCIEEKTRINKIGAMSRLEC